MIRHMAVTAISMFRTIQGREYYFVADSYSDIYMIDLQLFAIEKGWADLPIDAPGH